MSFFGMFSAIASGAAPTIARTETSGFIVSTVDTTDMGPETAILDNEGAHPVERYDSEAAALIGHAEWVAKIEGGLRSITMIGYGDLVDDCEITLEPIA